MFIILIKEWLSPEFTVFLALSTLIVLGILSPNEALRGFSNPGVHTVALLFIISSAVLKSGILDSLVGKLLNPQKSLSQLFLRLMFPVSTLSAFMNNTPIVTMFIPTLQEWAVANNIKPSKLLIPLSYAAILGGTITLIGTSTNLIVHGMLLEKGAEGFHFFSFAYFGVPLVIAGVVYFYLFGKSLLPDRIPNMEHYQDTKQKYIQFYIVEEGSPLIGKSIAEAMLRNLSQLFLIQINRKGQHIVPAPNDEVIQQEDILLFSGDSNEMSRITGFLGLKLYRERQEYITEMQYSTLYEVSISINSPLVYKKIKDSNFRSKYNAAIVSVKSKGKEINAGIGNVILKPGDTLLLIAKNDFLKTWSDSEDFYIISPYSKPKKQESPKKVTVIIILAGLFLGSVLQILPIFHLVLIASAILIVTKVLTVPEAIKAVNLNVIVLMGSAIGIGYAVESTKLAHFLAGYFINLQSELGIIAILIVFYCITAIITEILNNLATAALMFPIGYSISLTLNIDPMMFAMITAVAASCSFLSPIGYQTNLLVYGPGGYKFIDYLKVGLPLSVLCMLITICISIIKWL
jgi:di/tricarboxylate transporter